MVFGILFRSLGEKTADIAICLHVPLDLRHGTQQMGNNAQARNENERNTAVKQDLSSAYIHACTMIPSTLAM